MQQPVFMVAAAAGALGYGVMNLLMAATPLAMQQCGLPFGDAALVLESACDWHVCPGFFTGHLIKRFGALTGHGRGRAADDTGCIAVALTGRRTARSSWRRCSCCGVGWNFLFTGSTTLSLQTYAPEEDRAQGAWSFYVLQVVAMSSFRSGLLVTTQGWTLLNQGSLLPLALVGAGLLWLSAPPTAGRPWRHGQLEC